MKKFMMTLAAVLCCAMTTTVLTACGGDDKDTPGPDNTPVTAQLLSEFKPSEDLLKYMDVTVEYYDASGSIQKETITGDWTKTVRARIPAKLGIHVTIKLKDGVDVSTIDKATMGYKTNFVANNLNAANEKVDPERREWPESSLVVPGNKIKEYVERHKDNLYSVLYVFDGNTIVDTSWN